ncbi:hypothetical protein DFS33DRAFT_1446677 [Desarmillaria ectypa]|nr:hypothetical protein DFS33DRAFT_1446677 [Desarmillaria ectypa]
MHSTPVYKHSTTFSEVTLHDNSASSSGLPRWIYTTKHMRVDLGTQGSIRFSGNPCNVSKVTVAWSSTLVSRTISVYTPFSASSTQWNDGCAFSLPIPSEINTNGGTSPSFSYHSYNAMCDVSYFIKVCMVRKRNGFSTHESIKDRNDVSKAYDATVVGFEGRCQLTGALGDFDNAVHVFISSTTLASGDRIPFSVRIDTAKHPVLSQVSDKNIHVVLVNRMLLWSSSALSKIVSSERQIASSSVQRKDDSQGSLLVQGYIQAGCAGKENSRCLALTVL